MTVREWWRLARPPTLPASVVPVAVGTAAALDAGRVSVPAVLVMLLVALLLQIATNMANEYADFRRGVDSADSVGIAGVLVEGRFAPATVRRWAFGTYAAAFLLGLGLVAVRGWVLLVLGILGILAGYLYNAGPRPLSATPWGEATVFVIMGPIEVLGSELAAGGRVTAIGVWASVAVGFLVAAILLANNLRDRVQDGQRGRDTLAIRLGAKRGLWGMAALITAGALWPVALAVWGILPATAAVTALVLPGGLAAVRRLSGQGLARGVLVTGRVHLAAGLLLAVGLGWRHI